jgi:uncharacterized protein
MRTDILISGLFLLRRSTPAALLLALLLNAMPLAARAGFDDATAAFSVGKFDQALNEFRSLAEAGHSEAEFMLGVMYFQGRGVPQNRAIAAVWFHKSALKGHGGAQLALGSINIRGVGVYQNLHEAYKWLTLAAASASPDIKGKAVVLLQDAGRLMTPDEIDAAKSSVDNFEPFQSGLTSK